MKKFITSVLGLAFFVCAAIGLTACGESGSPSSPNLMDCEIGYELPVYPACEFDYKINNECTVHIKTMTATLIEKHLVLEGDTLQGEYAPCVVKLSAHGTTNPSNAGKVVSFKYKYEEGFRSAVSATIAQDGTLEWEDTISLHGSFTFYFYSMEIV